MGFRIDDESGNAAIQEAGALVECAFSNIIAMTALRSVFEIGLLDHLPEDRPMTAEDLAIRSGAERGLVIRLMRPLTAIGVFEEVDLATYRHSPLSIAFKDVRLRSYMQMGWDLWLPVFGSLHTWLKDNHFQLSEEQSHTPFAAVHHDTMFGFLDKNPAQAAVFNDSNAHLAIPVTGMFPFQERCSIEADSRREPQQKLLVDVGGGKGQASREILRECPALESNILLQDQPSVVAELPNELFGKVKTMGYNFFDPQPVKGAAFYYMRNILCDWPDVKCVNILKNQASAMSAKSRLLLAARIVPEAQVDPVTAAMDICMLTYGGAERTEKHYEQLLNAAGLVVEKFWTAEDASCGVFEARLAVEVWADLSNQRSCGVDPENNTRAVERDNGSDRTFRLVQRAQAAKL